jgi:hypothetical protein
VLLPWRNEADGTRRRKSVFTAKIQDPPRFSKPTAECHQEQRGCFHSDGAFVLSISQVRRARLPASCG